MLKIKSPLPTLFFVRLQPGPPPTPPPSLLSVAMTKSKKKTASSPKPSSTPRKKLNVADVVQVDAQPTARSLLLFASVLVALYSYFWFDTFVPPDDPFAAGANRLPNSVIQKSYFSTGNHKTTPLSVSADNVRDRYMRTIAPSDPQAAGMLTKVMQRALNDPSNADGLANFGNMIMRLVEGHIAGHPPLLKMVASGGGGGGGGGSGGGSGGGGGDAGGGRRRELLSSQQVSLLSRLEALVQSKHYLASFLPSCLRLFATEITCF